MKEKTFFLKGRKKNIKAKRVFGIVSIIIAIFIILFLIFLISDYKTRLDTNTNQSSQNQTQQNQSQQPITQNESTQQNSSENESNNNTNSEKEPVSLDPFTYNGLNFKVEQKNNKTTYLTKIKLLDRYGLQPTITTISFRNDPRQFGGISSNLAKKPNQKTYIAFDSSALVCDDSTMLAMTMGYFLGLFGIDAESAFADSKLAEGKTEDEIKTCEDASSSESVIVLKSGETSEIIQEGYCININIANCESVKTAEKFILNLIELGIADGTIEPKEI